MSVKEDEVSPADAAEKCSIGISFGNSNSSIAYTSTVRAPATRNLTMVAG